MRPYAISIDLTRRHVRDNMEINNYIGQFIFWFLNRIAPELLIVQKYPNTSHISIPYVWHRFWWCDENKFINLCFCKWSNSPQRPTRISRCSTSTWSTCTISEWFYSNSIESWCSNLCQTKFDSDIWEVVSLKLNVRYAFSNQTVGITVNWSVWRITQKTNAAAFHSGCRVSFYLFI